MKRSAALVIVLVVGIWLRWYGIDWALPHIFHPDETRLLYAVNDISWNNLNPKFFAYGSLPIYLLKIVHVASQTVAAWLGKPPYINFFLVGRVVSALFGSLTILLLYLLGKRGFSERVGGLSAAFLALTVLHIQLSHFLTVDVMLTFFVVTAFYFLISLPEGRHLLRDYLLSGVCIGLALATKISALPLFGVFFVSHLFTLLDRNPSARKGRTSERSALFLWGMFIAALLASGLVFLLCQPYALLDFREFWRQIQEQSNMVQGRWRPPYILQYDHTAPYWYPIKHLILYSMGLPLGVLTILGTISMLIRVIKGLTFHRSYALPCRWQAIVLLFAWTLPVFWLVGGFHVKFLRYMLPLIPFLCLLAAIFIDDLLQRFPSWKIGVAFVLIGVLGFSAFYSAAFVSIYQREDPRVQASRWIYNHIESGKTLLTELWEFAPLVSVAGKHPAEYRILELDVYTSDSDAKIRTIAQQLSETDVIVMATRRLYGSILRVTKQFPLTANYYKLLFDGVLGFTPVEPFTSYPSLLGITFNDDLADESFSVYDHPKTILFRKTQQISADDLYALILSAPPVEVVGPQLERMLTFPRQETQAVFLDPTLAPSQEGKWSEYLMFVLWVLVVEFLALLALPFTTLAFRSLPDVGYGVSKIAGLLLPAYLVWLGVNLGLFPYNRMAIVMVIGIVLLSAFMIVSRFRSFFTELLQGKGRIFLIYEIVFLLAFEAFVIFRAYNPDIFWSESSMDFSFLTVLTRAETLPPPDPWMSGFPLNYYYFGHFLVATLTKLTGVLPQFSYNLAFALWPALVIVLVFSILYNLTQRYLYGTIGAIFACILGNLDGFFLLIDWLRKKEHVYRFFRPAHEVIPYTVHEFPFWTFIFVDLHAHLLNMPFLIAAFLVGLHLLFAKGEHAHTFPEPPLAHFVEAGLTILLIGTLGVISSWDYPTGLIFLLLIALINCWQNRYRQHRPWKSAFQPLGYVLGIILPGSLLVYLPFYVGFSRSGMGLGLVGASTTRLSDFLTIFGVFLFFIFSYLFFRNRQYQFYHHFWRIFIFLLSAAIILYVSAFRILHVNYATLLFAVFTLVFGSFVLLQDHSRAVPDAYRCPQQLFIWVCLSYACLIVAGCEIIFVRDFLQGGQETYLLPFFNRAITFYTGDYKRMNTIFKFYIPVWFLFSIVAAYSVSRIMPGFKQRVIRWGSYPPLSPPRRGILKITWLAVGGLLLACAAVFPVMSIYARRHQQDVYYRTYIAPTLDGLAYLNATRPDEYLAIRWLQTHVAGTPVVLEATGPDYLYEYARISANTGLPTVLGWKSHADQREHWHRTHQREQDSREIYTNPNIQRTLQLLRAYQVQYIYIGFTERRDFSEEQLQKFANVPQYFEQVFQAGGVVIYRVRNQF
ncbi:glycosyl transferase family 39 [Candidatus Vecturithrix granuli]|uniref:Glycosyl transferase family 39 n=1 Tax=Vecturithrix granuli TaxID=1499967 RepID=A0A0S6W5G8_VECG1|nr:glycosyl transferase family 39 [Candidatus Vecturithrix granuli]